MDINEILDSLYKDEDRQFFYKTKIRDHLQKFIRPKEKGSEKYSDDEKERIYKVDRKIMDNLDVHYTAADLTRIACMTEAKLLEAFRDIIGVSMFERYKEAKLQMAKAYLLETKMRVKEIYEKVGYESETGFIDAFRTRFGSSPTKFRKDNRPFD